MTYPKRWPGQRLSKAGPRAPTGRPAPSLPLSAIPETQILILLPLSYISVAH